MKIDWKAVAPLALGGAILLSPVPAGLSAQAWQFFALFVTVIAALILEPIPAAAIGLMGVTFGAALIMVPGEAGAPGTTADGLRFALSGFSNGTVWLIFTAYMFSLGYEKTGLGKRISLLLIKALGKKTLGLGYAVALADLAVAPFTPSNTARSGGIIFPIIKNIPPLYGSTPEEGRRKIGGLRDVDGDGHDLRDEQHVPHRPRAEPPGHRDPAEDLEDLDLVDRVVRRHRAGAASSSSCWCPGSCT